MTKSPDRIPLFEGGEWTTSPNPLAGYDVGQHLDKTMRKAGFAGFVFLGCLGSFRVTLWRRDEANLSVGDFRFIVSTETPDDAVELVAAEGWVDTMDLLSRWAPALQAAAINDLTSWAKTSGDEGNPFFTVGAALAAGAGFARES